LDCDEEFYFWKFNGNEKKCLGMCALSCFCNLKHTFNFLSVEFFLVLKIPTLLICFGYTVLKTVVLPGHG
jgi:hypothetical protein